MSLNKKAYFIALGGINEKNYKNDKIIKNKWICLYYFSICEMLDKLNNNISDNAKAELCFAKKTA